MPSSAGAGASGAGAPREGALSWPPDPADYDDHGYDPDSTAADCDRLEALLARHLSHADDTVSAPVLLDLACGTGRHAGELARRGHRVVGVDRAVGWLRHAQTRQPGPRYVAGDLRALPLADASVDLAFCLFNTLMELVDNDVALGLFRGAARALRPGGLLVIDDFPAEMWAEVADGNWATGLADDLGSQLIWQPGENTFALRRGDEVRPDDWAIRDDDRLYRMWSRRDLRLLARVAGLDELEAEPDLVFRRP